MRSGMKSSQLKSPVFKIQIASCFNSPRVELVLRFERLLSSADNGQTLNEVDPRIPRRFLRAEQKEGICSEF